MSFQGVLSAPEVSGAAVKAVWAAAAGYGQGAHFWWHSSGWAARYERLRNEFLPAVGAQARPKGWDGKGAPRNSRPAPPAVETQQDRDRKIARVKIFPGDVELKTGEQVIFSAVAFDNDNNPVGGVDVKWEALHEEKNQPLTITSPGTFVSGVPGKFIVTAEVAGRKEHVKVTVTGEARRPNIKSQSEESKSSRESGHVGSLRAPIQGDQKRVARRGSRAGAVALAGLPGPLRAASAPMASRPAVLDGEDDKGWNSSNNRTADDVGAERGSFPGRAVDGGVGSSNFQFAAPGVVMDGRGIDLNLLFNYNSRVWHKAGNKITHNIDREAIAGWSFGFGKIVMAGDAYMLIDGDGTRHSYEGTLRRNFPAPFSSLQSFEANTTDGTFINYYAEGYQPQFDNSGGRNMVLAWAVLPNGTRIEYGAQANYAMYPTRITDAHGNFITITYLNNQGPDIQTLTDPLGRVIYFYYDWQGLLTSIAVPNHQGGGYRAIVRLQYQWLTLSNAGANYGFAGGLTTMVRQNVIPVIRAIYYPGTGTGYWFGGADSYSPYGMLCKVSERRNMTFDNAPWDQQGNIGAGVMSREMVYNYPQSGGSFADMPTYTQMVEDWAGRTTDAPPVTYFSVVDSGGQRTTTITRPDGAQIRQIADIASGLLQEDGLYRDGVALQRSKAFWETGAYNSPRPTQTQIWDEKGRMRATTYSYDPAYGSLYNSPTDVRTYGYNGELLRQARTEYLNVPNYNGSLRNSGTLWLRGPGLLYGGPIWVGSHIFNLVSVNEVYAGDGVMRLARTEYQYDGLGLIDNPSMVQHNITYNPYTPPREVCENVPNPNDPDCQECPPPIECRIEDGYCSYITVCNYYPQYDSRTGYRGNVTQIKRYADATTLDGGTATVETRTYDIAGNVREQSSSCCEKTTITYTTNTQYAWPESQTSGSPTDTSKQNATGATYDYWTGLVMTSTDANGRVSQNVYDPNTLRVVYEYSPTGAYQYHFYDDQNLFVADMVYEAGRSGANFASRSDRYLDGHGRGVRDVAYGKDYVWDAVDTKFDNLGRVSQQSRPYRYGSETPQWGTVTYDLLGRPVQTVNPDGSVVTRAYDQSDPPGSSGQPGPTVKATDPWGRERWARSDALGRLVEVAEPNPGGAGSLSGGAMYTTYSYDALDRLVQVSQGQQRRAFGYDSLGRLTHQKLAELAGALNDIGQWVGSGQWSDVFFYDTRSNLVRRVDARGVQTRYDFNDPLNRLLSVQYDKSGVPANLSAGIADAPNVNYAYMTSGDKSRAENISVTNGMGSEQLSYDSEGRLAQVRQTFAGREGYPILNNYVWDSVDRPMEHTYPQQYGAGEIRKKVEPAYDIASRIDSLKFGGVTYASNPVYNASSQATSLDVGAQIKELYGFDPKTGLMTGQQVKRGADLLVDLKYNYTLNNDSNNNGAKTGQLTSLTDLKNTARNQAYVYDTLGRLTKVKGGADAFNNPAWSQNYSYDRFGNKGTVSQAPDETVWVEDTLPAGAVPGADGGDGWNWINSAPSPLSGSVSHISNIADVAWSPPPYSGNVSHQSGIVAGGHQQYFWGSTFKFPVRQGGKLYAHVYLDPQNPPQEMMLQWGSTTQGWNHRAYWGANLIGFGTDGTTSRRYMGPLPAAGGWVRLEVPASAVGLEGKEVDSMAFTLYGGRANWDLAGIEGVNYVSHQECYWDCSLGECYERCDTITEEQYENYVLMDDSIPAGATPGADGGYGWNWTGARTPQPFHQHYFYGATNTLNVNAGDTLYTWAYLDSANMPEEIMLQWNDGSWEHRAYWGANRLGWGVDGTASRKYMGGLPAAGGWVKLEVPASAVGLEGRAVNGMAFTLYGGRVAWDMSGRKGAPPAGPPNPVMGRDGFDNLAYNAVNNQIISPGFAYDYSGNLTKAVVDGSGSQQQYRYDCANRLVQVSDGSGNVLATHAYGAGNRRLMSVEGGVTKYFAWAEKQIVAEYEAFGTNGLIWKTSYVFLGDRLLATTSGSGGTETRFHHPGRLGIRLATAEDGAVATEQFTMPFGNMLPFTSVPGGENPYQNPTLANPSKKRFTSYDRSIVTTMDYAVNRFYSSQQGRFTQVDPIGMDAVSLSDPQTLNLYAYCGNNPTNQVDPGGLFFGKLFGWIGKAFKFLFKVVAVALFVAAMVLLPGMIATGGFWLANGAFFGWGSWAALMGLAGVAGLAGWHNGKLGTIAGAFLNRIGSGSNFRTPNTFPNATGVGGVSNFLSTQRRKPRALILVGDQGIGLHNVGRNFLRAAAARQTALERQGYEVIRKRVSSVTDINNQLASNGKLDIVEYYGHSSPSSLFVGEGVGADTNLDDSNLSTLSNANLNEGCTITLNSCNAGRGSSSIASKISHRLGRKVYAYDGPTRFSTSPDRLDGLSRPPETGPLYLLPDHGASKRTFTP